MFRMKVFGGIFFLLMGLCLCLFGHEGHFGASLVSEGGGANPLSAGALSPAAASGWLPAIGRFHLLFLHFPIALTVMTVVAELLWIWFASPLFTHAARFMILAAAIFAVPTAFFGWALGYGQVYEGVQLDLFVWHRYFGFMTAGLAIIAAILRERCAQEKTSSTVGYYLCLLLLFISVSLTGAFGGSLAFGLDVW